MLAWRRFVQVSALLVLVIGPLRPVVAQSFLIGPLLSESQSTEPELPPQQPSAAERRAENADQLRHAQLRQEGNATPDGVTAQDVAFHQSLEAVLAQQQAIEEQLQELEARKTTLELEWRSLAGVPAPEPLSFIELDSLKDELASERSREKLREDKLEASKAGAERAQRVADDSLSKSRQAQSAYESGKDGPNAAELAAAAERARQASQLATETLTLRKRESERDRSALEVQRLTVRIAEQHVLRMVPQVEFSEEDYEAQLSDLAAREEAANRSLERAQASRHSIELDLQEAQRLHDAETGDRTVLAERLAAQRRARERISDDIDSLMQRLQRFAELRLAWYRRFQIATFDRTDPDKRTWSELKDWQRETRTTLEGLATSLRTQILRMRDLRSTLTSISKKIDAAKNGAEEQLPWLEMQRSQVEAMLRIRERDLVTIETSRRVHERLAEEIGLHVQTVSPRTIALGAWYQTKQIWEFPLVSSISDEPITVQKLVTGMVLFVGGWLVSRFLAAMFAYRLLKRFRLSKDGSAAIRTIVFYTLLTIAALAALKVISVPLTAFTILGGALAIGVGFGSQALVNNFIGGLIMLAERPVRLGERISFGDYDGVVEDVGFRCTKLRTLTDHLVTIPNSTLVNESIENVARRRTIRRLMNVTITYDTPRAKVAAAVEAIREILEEKGIRERIHPIVGFEEFPPRVFFNDFNAESLNILVIYWFAPTDWWAYVEHCQRVNLRIMEEFERLGVEFAFPSRTVYVKNLDHQAPSIEMARNGEQSALPIGK